MGDRPSNDNGSRTNGREISVQMQPMSKTVAKAAGSQLRTIGRTREIAAGYTAACKKRPVLFNISGRSRCLGDPSLRFLHIYPRIPPSFCRAAICVPLNNYGKPATAGRARCLQTNASSRRDDRALSRS